MSAVTARLIIGAVLFGAWGWLVATKQTPVEPFVHFVEITLTALVTHYITKGKAPP